MSMPIPVSASPPSWRRPTSTLGVSTMRLPMVMLCDPSSAVRSRLTAAFVASSRPPRPFASAVRVPTHRASVTPTVAVRGPAPDTALAWFDDRRRLVGVATRLCQRATARPQSISSWHRRLLSSAAEASRSPGSLASSRSTIIRRRRLSAGSPSAEALAFSWFPIPFIRLPRSMVVIPLSSPLNAAGFPRRRRPAGAAGRHELLWARLASRAQASLDRQRAGLSPQRRRGN